MKVVLKRHFFAGGRLYKSRGDRAVELPEALRKSLPKDAKVVGEEAPPPEVKSKKES